MSPSTVGWILIVVAGMLEVLWPIGMKNGENFTRWGWVAVMVASMIASFGLLTVAVSPRYKLPIGTAYAVWTGMGAAGAALVGIYLFKEPRSAGRLFFMALIVAGIIGLKVTHREPPKAEEPAAAPRQGEPQP